MITLVKHKNLQINFYFMKLKNYKFKRKPVRLKKLSSETLR